MILKLVLALIALAVLVFIALYLFAPLKLVDTALSLERMRAGLQRSELDITVDGRRFHLVHLEGGPANAPPLLLLHGIGADKDNWTRVAASGLSKRYRVLAPDLPGFGESAKPDDARYRIQDQVARVAAYLDALGVQGPVHVGGNSMGGWIAAAFALAYPDRVASLWLLDPAGVMTADESEMMRLMAAGMPLPLFARSEPDFARLLRFAMEKPPYIPAPVRAVLARRQIANYRLNEQIFGEIREQSGALDAELAARQPPLPTPTLVVWGECDRVLHPSGARILGGLLPNATVALLPGIGHLPMLETPARATADYLAFRDRLAAAR